MPSLDPFRISRTHLLCGLLWPATWTAQAQPAEPPAPTLPTVVVTGQAHPEDQATPDLATGLPGTRMSTPFSTTRVAGERVREQGGTTLQDALRNVPGAQADSGFNGSHTQFFILRGAVTDSGTGSNRVLRDGVRLSNYPYVPAFVDSVDVLRGPGAAVGVRSEPGGTVNLTTRQPQGSDAGSVFLGAGSAGAREAAVDLNRVLSAADAWSARLIATRSEASQWRHVPDRLDGVKLGLAKEGADGLRLRAGLEATNQTYRPDYGLPAIDGRIVAVPSDRQVGEPFGDSTTDNRIADLRAEMPLAAGARMTLALTHLEGRSTSIKNLLVGNPLAGQPVGTWARVSSWEPDTTRRIDSVAGTLGGGLDAGGWTHQLHGGLEYYHERLNQPTLSVPSATSPPINAFNPVYGLVTAPADGAVLPVTLTTQQLEALGASLHDQVDLGPWTLLAGLRLDRQRFRFGTAAVLPVREARWSPKAALLRRLSAGDTVYAHLSSGMSPNQVVSSSNQSLPSRRSAQAELGWKSSWRGGKVISELAVFRLDQSHMISADTSTTTNNFDLTVAGTTRSQGVAASLAGALSAAVEVSASYAYTDAAYRQNAGGYAFKRVPNVARQVLHLWGRYRWSEDCSSGAAVQAQGRRFADEATTTVLPGHVRLDLTQAWQLRRPHGQSLELQLALRNALDARYEVSSHLHVSRWITSGQGRNLALSALYRF